MVRDEKVHLSCCLFIGEISLYCTQTFLRFLLFVHIWTEIITIAGEERNPRRDSFGIPHCKWTYGVSVASLGGIGIASIKRKTPPRLYR